MGTTGLAEQVAVRERAFLERLTVATAGSGLCHPSGGAPAARGAAGAKTLEGAVAALAEARRAFRAHDAAGHPSPSTGDADRQPGSERDVLTHVHAAWLARASTLAARGEAWHDYLEGGLTALRSLIDEHPEAREEGGLLVGGAS